MAESSDRDHAEQNLLLPPRENLTFFGHEAAEAELLAALASKRMPHAWLITGPKGVGKATLAFRLARRLLSRMPRRREESLEVAETDPVIRQIAGGATQDLLVIERPADAKTGELKGQIPVSAVRELQRFFSLAAGGGGWRIVIVDAVDDLNRNAANALLKSLEEPPSGGLMILVAHAIGRVLPTIRSRCRQLRLTPLEPDQFEAAYEAELARIGLPMPPAEDRALISAISQGCLGQALQLTGQTTPPLYREFFGATQTPRSRRLEKSLAFADRLKSAAGDDSLALLDVLTTDVFARLARGAAGLPSAAGAPGPFEEIDKLAPALPASRWAELAADLRQLISKGEGLNLDEKWVAAEAYRRFAEACEIVRSEGDMRVR